MTAAMRSGTSAAAYTVDGRAVDDAHFYALACDPARPVVVEACAGAGKTWMLVSRIVRALLAGAHPQQVLAITFTRKAAGEMRERLDDWLREWASPAATHDARVLALRQRGLTEAAAQTLAEPLRQLQQRLLTSGRAVEVRTFHAWFAQLVSHAPMALLQRLELPAAMQLIEDTSVVHGELFRRFHAVVLNEPSVRADYAALVQRHRRTLVRTWLLTAMQRSAELLCADVAGTLETSVIPAAEFDPRCAGMAHPLELVRHGILQTELAALARALNAKGGANASKAAAKLVSASQCGSATEAFELTWEALFTDKGTPRKLGQVPGLEAACAELGALRELSLQHEGYADHQRMVRLSRVLLAEFAALKRRQGLVDMTDLERAALAMLGDATLAPWLQERLDTQLRHVLIDEFQDTSPLQWQALHGWLSAYAGAGGGAAPPTLFIVGDPKQSIYRFRRAEPRVFDAAKAFVTQGLGGSVLACDHTRRNAAAVVAALNPLFEEAAALDAWQAFRQHTTASGLAGAVHHLPEVLRDGARATAVRSDEWRPSLTQAKVEVEERLRVQEARHVAGAVVHLLASGEARAGEIMVLARTRAVLATMAQALAASGVAHVVPEARLLAEAPESLDLIAALDVLASPGNDLALARVLKSPLMACSDDDLLWLSQQARKQRRPWLQSLVDADDVSGAALLRAQRLWRDWRQAARELTPHELVERIVFDSDAIARLLTTVPAPRRAAAVDAVHGVIAAAVDQRGGRFATLHGFVRELKSEAAKIASLAPADAVQLLTVHGAKGLEARVVFIVDADPENRPSSGGTLLIDWPVESAAPRCAAFVARESKLPPSLRGLLAEELVAREREALNALYVAMTRARERLVLSRTQPHIAAPGRSWWARVMAHAAPPVLLPPEDSVVLAAQATVDVPRLPVLITRPLAASADPTRDAAAARLGQAVHRWLEWATRPQQSRNAWPALALAAAQSHGLDTTAAAAIHATGQAVLESPACARFFDPAQLRWAGNEVALAWQGGVLRVDRLVQLHEGTAPTWWVLDYKLHAAPGEVAAYRAQLAQYVAAVQALVPVESVQGAFITAGGALVLL